MLYLVTRVFKTTLAGSSVRPQYIVGMNKESKKTLTQFSQEQTYTDWAYIS